MKNNYFYLISLTLLSLAQTNLFSQCATTATLGTSSNMFTLIRNSTNPISADNSINTIVHIHRNNINIFGGDNGGLRYDVSTNAGATWTNEIGLLNPALTPTNSGRYPNITIYNPPGNVNPNNAYLAHQDATVDFANNIWTGRVTGVRQLNGAGNTENYNQAGPGNMLIPQSLVKGAPGVFWSVDAIYNGGLITGYKVYKGTWNGVSDITWATNYSVTPSFVNGYNNYGDYNIAFDPTGNTGYLSFLGHLTGGPVNNAMYPVFYKTTDGGNTWSGPVLVDINQFNCITSNIAPGNVATCAFEHDLTVDINGNPHFLTTACNGDNAYSVLFSNWHHMVDITSFNGLWNAYDVSNVQAGRAVLGANPNIAYFDFAPQASRSSDGKKIFFTWADNSTYFLGAANTSPNLFARGFDVQTYQWTPVQDFTSCNPSTSGLIFFPHIAPEVLQPTPTTYKLPVMYGEFTVPNDPIYAANFRFLGNMIMANASFSINQVMPIVSIAEGSTLLLCPNVASTLNISGVFDAVLWSNGTITNSNSINAPGNYIVTARAGCYFNADTIAVTGLTANISPTVSNICPGNTVTLTVSGNAFGYTWTPGNILSTSIAVTPTTTTIYTISASGSSCTLPQTIAVNVTVPSLTITGNSTVCLGSFVTQTVTGANTYSWSNGSLTPTISVSPSVNTTYTVTGTDANSCINTKTVSVSPVALPNFSVSGSGSVCTGQTATLSVPAANTYSWSTGATSSSITVSPTVTTVYSVTGTSTLSGCARTVTATVVINSCIGIEELSDYKNIIVAPNPNNGTFNIRMDIIADNSGLILLNNLGQIVLKQKLMPGNNLIDASALAKGIYYYSVLQNSLTIKKGKLMVE